MTDATLTFLGGTDTVGGVQILAQAGTGALVFDLGVVGNPGISRSAALFNELMAPRLTSALADYLKAGMAPLLEGFYDEALVDGSVANSTRALRRPSYALADRQTIDLSKSARAVFLSHLHADHAGLAHFVGSATPLLMSPDSAQLYAAQVRAGVVPATIAPIKALDPAQPYQLGDMAIHVIPVDHDVPGSAGILVESGQSRFAYTGDWRGHGVHPERMDDFAQICRGVDVLITEASTADHSPDWAALQLPEADIGPWFDDVVARTHGAVYVAFHSQNLERQEQLRRVAVAQGRRFVLSPPTARIWAALVESGSHLVSLESVSVWSERNSGLDSPRMIPTASVEDLASDPSAWVAELPTTLRPLLLDIGTGPLDTFVHLNGHPYGTDDVSWPVLETWVRTLGMRFAVASSHGHASREDLQAFVESVRPGMVVPVHTNSPRGFPAVSVPVRPVRRGETIGVNAVDIHKAGTCA